jgi:hypothetical protein
MVKNPIFFTSIIIALALNRTVLAYDLSVNGNCNIYGAGHPAPNNAPTLGTHGGGIPPASVSLSLLGNPSTLNIKASGTVSFCTSCGNNGPNGTSSFITDAAPLRGISGITNLPARSLVAVFTSDVEPFDPAPASLNFGSIGTGYSTLSPLLRQMFFVGTGSNSLSTSTQAILVPSGATHIYFGLVDGYSYQDTPDGYEDNNGAFSVSINPSLYLKIDSQNSIPGVSVYGATGSTNRLEYLASLSSTNWTFLTNVILNTSPTRITDASFSTNKTRYYRAVKLP